MAVKFDKDMLIKHRFWLLLALTLPLVLVAIFLLITSVGAETDKKRKEVEGMEKSLKPGQVVGPQVNVLMQKAAEAHKAGETQVHAEAFNAQESIFVFPKAVESRFDFRKGLFATEIKIMGKGEPKDWPADDVHLFHGVVIAVDEDSVTLKGKEKAQKDTEGKDLERKDKTAKFYQTTMLKVSNAEKKEGEREPRFGNIRDEDFLAITFYKSKYFYDKFTVSEQEHFARSYMSQIHDILKIVDPVDEKGNGVVQLKGWLYNENRYPPPKAPFFTYVPGDWKRDAPIYREAWLAQEDLWIQREIYQLIRNANDAVGKCVSDRNRPSTFTNPKFEFQFDWSDTKLKVTVSNLLLRRQKLDLLLRIKFNKSDNPALSSETVLIADEPLEGKGAPKGASRTIEITLDKTGIQRIGIFEVEQVLTWETAPVKRLDELSIGWLSGSPAHSHRTIAEGSKTYRKDDMPSEEKKEGGEPRGGGTPPGMAMPMAPGGGMAAFGAAGGGAQSGILGINGVLFDRYLEVTEQSRRVPVAVALIVDQDNIDRVLNSFNNSKMRFLITQVLVNRYPNSVRPQLLGQGPVADGEGLPGGVAALPPPIFGFGGKKGFGAAAMPPAAMPPGADGAVGMMTGLGGTNISNEELENNVELVIYGIVTLYERYPKRTVQVGENKDAK